MLIIALLGQCAGVRNKKGEDGELGRGTTEEMPAAGEDFFFCPIKPLLLEKETSGGLASLATVLDYWDTESSESALAERYPVESGGYEILKLRRIAIDEGLMAFALTMKEQPLEQLGEQLEHGRPVIVPLEQSIGDVFGAPVDDLQEFSSIRRGEVVHASEGNRYVVVFGQSKSQFLVLDPGFGVVSVDKDIFGEEWGRKNYSALLCSSF
ncbi:MAG: cysteine peptidase family C39 domain-containing protein [Verrucomicrobiota bacterium]